MKDKINLLREQLYLLLETKKINHVEVIKISHELDNAILDHIYEENFKKNMAYNMVEEG